ncbi:MAG: hypothetical protein JST00_25320 [Deltaproteobacteria bacterium]|nr:hypothetical protein [Deltaproteobacteria bacterium]
MVPQGMYRDGGQVSAGLPFPRANIPRFTTAITLTAVAAITSSSALFLAVARGAGRASSAFRGAGWSMYLVVAAGVLVPALIAFFGALLVRGKRLPAAALFACASVPFAIALLGAWMDESLVLRVVRGGAVDPDHQMRLLAAGLGETRGNDVLGGIVACGAALVATLGAASAAASIDVRLATKGEPRRSIGQALAAACGGAWLVATVALGLVRAESMGTVALAPALPLLVVVVAAVLAARGVVAVRGWHDRREAARVLGALFVAGASALLAVLALEWAIDASVLGAALSALSGDALDVRVSILTHAAEAQRLSALSYGMHAVLGIATFGCALAPAIGRGAHPATPGAFVCVAIGLGLLGAATAIGGVRERAPKELAAALRPSIPPGIALPSLPGSLPGQRRNIAWNTAVVVAKGDAADEARPSTLRDVTVVADEGATLGAVRARLPREGRSRVTFVAAREGASAASARAGALAPFLPPFAFVPVSVDDEGSGATDYETLHVVSRMDGNVELDGKRFVLPLSDAAMSEAGTPASKRFVHYTFLPSDTVARALAIIDDVERARPGTIPTWDAQRFVIVADPARPRIRIASVVTSVRLAAETFRSSVQGGLGWARTCYEAGLRRDPELAGRVALHLVFAPTGKVLTVVDDGSRIPDRETVNCIVGRFAALELPPLGADEQRGTAVLDLSPPP